MPSSELPTTGADLGLLSPVRAGSAAEAATGDAAYLRAMLDAEVALVRAQAALGLAPRSAAEAVATAAARQETFDARALALAAPAGGNPVIPLVGALRRAVGEVDGDENAAWYVHRGATSQDILDTAAMLVASRTLGPALEDLASAAAHLAALAREHRGTPLPARTLSQQAVPTTFGLKATGWHSLLLDAHARLSAVRDGLPAQLGGAAGTLAAFHTAAERAGVPTGDLAPRLLSAYAEETGLAEPLLPWHTLRTPVADLAGALAFAAGALGKAAQDVLVLSRTEIGEVAEEAGGGSSAMPHKANPVQAALVASCTRHVPNLAAVLYGSLAAEDERPPGAWHAEWQPLREALRLVGGAARATVGLVQGLRVRPERMAENLARTGGLVVSERLTAELAAVLAAPDAGEVLDRAVARASQEGSPLADVLAEEPRVAAVLPVERLRELLDPAGYLGAAPALVDRGLARRSPAPPTHP
ncbi:3-carboxy-cis,cis-muconate cycloisomerase [Streptomyces xiaopingdaonensis]|uniref:3-carboxy-cis,cis-muconate cycloisomerase n=1 Tax=Streptomyces xiaopingdaonensis TaxID=1565415 RepID=UPI0002FF7F0F|nr:3-carboxy-cis,cis-muconate cycloisomerase [Streptomyces xiaopingdaonensis]